MSKKIIYEVTLYTDYPLKYHVRYQGLRCCGRFSGGETFKNESEAEHYAKNIVDKYKWLENGYAHITKTTYLGLVEG